MLTSISNVFLPKTTNTILYESFSFGSVSMNTRGFVLFLLSAFPLPIISVLFNSDFNNQRTVLSSSNSYVDSTRTVWPKLKLSLRLVLVIVIGFLGSACGTIDGVGGGGIFV